MQAAPAAIMWILGKKSVYSIQLNVSIIVRDAICLCEMAMKTFYEALFYYQFQNNINKKPKLYHFSSIALA